MSISRKTSICNRLTGVLRRIQFFHDFRTAPKKLEHFEHLQHQPNKLNRHVFQPLTSSVCLFAHFTPGQSISESTFYYLSSLHQNGFSLVFITTMNTLSAEDLQRLKLLCAAVIRRPNMGFDFGSWATALHMFPEIWHSSELILCNDSVWGPFYDLGPSVQRMRACLDQVSGFTLSNEIKKHLQSYFLYIPRIVLQSGVFKQFWDDFRFLRIKENIIQRCEINFSQMMLVHGFGLNPICPVSSIKRWEGGSWYDRQLAQNKTPNPTQYFWRQLISQMQYPFIKKELVIRNPVGIPDLHLLDEVLTQTHSNYPETLKKEMLRQIKSLSVNE